MDDEHLVFPQVREYFIPREEYLAIIQDSPLYLFYSNVDWYESSRIQAGIEPSYVTLSGRLKTPEFKNISNSEILVDYTPTDLEYEYKFLAKFDAPHRVVDGATDFAWQDDFSLISSRWDEQGLRIRFNLKNKMYLRWHYFASIEPYLVHRKNTIYRLDNHFDGLRFSEGVHETVFAAHRLGYFESPRKVGLRQLAKHLGVSHMSVSRNLREFERLIVESYLKG